MSVQRTLAVTFVTGNANKLREVQQILAAGTGVAAAAGSEPAHTPPQDGASAVTPGVTLRAQSLDVPEVQGKIEEVARAKVLSAAKQYFSTPRAPDSPRRAVLTEDTALCFNALNGLPGPYIKDFLGNLGVEKLPRLLDGFGDTSAEAVCTFALALEPPTQGVNQDVLIFQGRTAGHIVDPRGGKKFGWDPVMEIDGTGLTYAEMPQEAKNKVCNQALSSGWWRGHPPACYSSFQV